MKEMKISLIVAISENNVIGKNNDLPWHMPADMAFFKEKTRGHTVVMGRKNYDSIPPKYRPLPNRTNIVVTRNPVFKAPGCIVAHSIGEVFTSHAMNRNDEELFVIGGGEIYEFTMIAFASKVYLTRIHAEVEGDIFFPKVDWSKWKLISERRCEPDEKHKYAYTFQEYERIY